MNNSQHPEPGKALRTLDKVIRIGRTILIFITVLAIPMIILGVSGRGSLSVSAELDDPYVIEFADGRRIGVNDGARSYENFDIGREHDTVAGVGDVGLAVNIARSDTASRVAISAVLFGWLGAAWIGLTQLGRMVTSALTGRVFADENPRRLRLLGSAIVATPVIGLVGRFVINQTLESDLPVTVSLGGTSLWVLAVIGLSMFALAEVFVEAARLREFEEATI